MKTNQLTVLKKSTRRHAEVKKLNSDKPYGRIVGRYEECLGAAFIQDGAFFDAHKNLIQQEEISHASKNEWKNEKGPHVQVNADGRGERQKQEDERQEDERQERRLLDNPLSESEPVPELEPDSGTYMTLTDKELDELAEAGMGPLREYAAMFGVKGVSKKQLTNGLKAQR